MPTLKHKFERQKIEDGPNPAATWGIDRTVPDAEDPNDEDNLPIPISVPNPTSGNPTSGKISAREPLRDWPDDDGENRVLLEVHNPVPDPFSYSLPSSSADPDGQIQELAPLAVGGRTQGRKRAGADTSDAGTSAPEVKRKKLAKRPGKKAIPKKPTAIG